MGSIRILPDRVANQIAAGEVVERPASIVKELVENALDAGATRIEIEFRHGGRSHIGITDNGCGMSRDDALLSLERHATSKIREARDLDSVRSFGFRGEALPSIASVSRFTLQTRDAASASGTEILVNGGRVVHVRECGMPVGTRIVVAQLFNSVPARRKFLKSDATEAAHIVHHGRLYALASPQAAFSLVEDGRTVFRSPVCATLEARVGEVFGRQIGAGLLPLEAKEDGLELRGLISGPGVARATRHEMITFVNRRPVDSRTLAYAVLESYHTLLPKGRYPVAFLFLEIDPAGVDVNVHPAKREVRFRDEVQVRGFTIRTVLAALRPGAAPVVERAPEAAPPPVSPPTPPAAGASIARVPPSVGAIPRPPPAPPVAAPARAVVRSHPAGWRLVGDIAGGYSLFETPAGLVVFDRRAASERVWFERLLAQQREGRVESQRLLLPAPLELDALAAATLREHGPLLAAHGIEVEPFGRDFFRVTAVPAWLEPGGAEGFVRDLLGLLRSGRIDGADPERARSELASVAAGRAALPQEAALPAAVLGELVVDLLRCATPHSSPRGRPTFIEIPAGELARRFHKVVTSPRPTLEPSP